MHHNIYARPLVVAVVLAVVVGALGVVLAAAALVCPSLGVSRQSSDFRSDASALLLFGV